MSDAAQDGDSGTGSTGGLVKISCGAQEEPLFLALLGPIPLNIGDVSNKVNHLQPSNKYQLINNNKSRVFKSNSTELKKKSNETSLVKLTVHSKDQYGLLTNLNHDYYIINYLNDPMDINQNSIMEPIKQSNDMIRHWSIQLPKEKQNNLKLSMTPPTEGSPVKSTNLPQEESEITTDPFDYFLDRYFDNLYLLTTPLTFFTKSTFTRLLTLCSSKEEYKSILEQFIIDQEFFDNRHLMSNNGILNSNLLYEKEDIYRKSFIQKSLNLIDFDIHSASNTETNKTLSNVLNNFKIRELHLQILLLLELIHVYDRDNVKFFKKPNKKKSLTKKSLVGRRKITPTINGSAIANTENNKLEKLTHNQNLDVYIDKLCIWNVLMGSSSSSTDNSTSKFLSYIVIPFFNKKCPNSVKHMLKKIKGPSFKTKSTTSKSKSSSSSSSSLSKSEKPSLKRSASISSSAASGSLSEIKRPSLSRTSSNVKLEDIQELKLSLSRSNSDLQNLKRTTSFNASQLSKRQVDMSLPVIPAEPETNTLKRNSSIFNRVGKKLPTFKSNSHNTLTSFSQPQQPSMSFSQVEATPQKPVKYIDSLNQATPKDTITTQVTSSSPIEYAKTPKVVQTPTVIRSSVRRPGEPLDFANPEDVQLLGSPMSKGARRRLFAPSK
ncbi:Arginine-glutamic acid dipeptide repeats protein [Wickerhamomyces ciferrii]|uniref:Arginine-glutamic acid dipeptide repeats protein n=1 Tax=Wickerhamomyces ciferrii (strain ATCC 14091 / BCRC 22168 / CBS 111 / JCM 3599 / NBRC 0793 / NRRL Y-1031 F-60-10) TaxID=1206466 RepID=K0KGK4_WICCF|nr:Arginine-glutamic acid dipeptide repeats protein [Wickerhamomyces ciferrii]CCH40564.1 Arginine-glutamic acid dipeptide repeats protein [Wickerhamomyces ciferrii]